MEENNRNLFLVVVLSILVMAGWQYFVVGPQMKADQANQARLAHQEKKQSLQSSPGIPGVTTPAGHLPRIAALKLGGPRIVIETPTVDGSLLLRGARFDDLRLKKYRETVDPKSPEIPLLAPKKTNFPYYVDTGWTALGSRAAVPTQDTVWKRASNNSLLTPARPVELEWDNGHGLVFRRRIVVDDKYMFTVSDSVTNHSRAAVSLYPYARVVREGRPNTQQLSVLHEGFVGYSNSLQDAEYTAVSFLGKFFGYREAPQKFDMNGGWLGITDKYWMAAVVPEAGGTYTGSFTILSPQGTEIPGSDVQPKTTSYVYEASYVATPNSGTVIAPNATSRASFRIFAGAKIVDVLRGYEQQGVSGFSYAIDWGWFWFLTKPLFWVLDHLFHVIGNFGLAILALTVCVKAITFPIANASAKTMAKMKKVQPEMERIKERFKDDAAKQQQEIMGLYKREKVNPLTGCVPQLLVIPVFFSLYKVFIVTIEMYHAPFYGWIKDLSAPDPTSILNLFGLLPYHIPAFVPAFLSIGIWPILMGITQWVQTKLNPPAPDPVQQRMFSLMPVMFTFMFATFASGLVIYYAWNNLLTIAQQMVIMRRQNVPIHLIENFKLPQPVQRAIAPIRRALSKPKTQAGE